MSFSRLPVSYCANVHPSLSVDGVFQTLFRYTLPIQKLVDRPIAVGLWMPQSVIEELPGRPDFAMKLSDELSSHKLLCYTFNAFPYGNFHSERVKENVYLPDWTDPARRVYTEACADILSQLVPDGIEGSISTMPLGFKRLSDRPGFLEATHENFLQLTRHLDELHDSTGKVIRIAVEPEPHCLLETTDETLAWYESLLSAAKKQDLEALVYRHIGLCFDTCHQAVEFEDMAEIIPRIEKAGIRINKVQMSSALELTNPATNAQGLKDLAAFNEPRYLHQTMIQSPGKDIERIEDLTSEALERLASASDATAARIHFHVPIHQSKMASLGTTQLQLREALEAIHKLDYPPHLEVETYTWSVMKPADENAIINGIAAEFAHVHKELHAIANPKPKFVNLMQSKK